MALSSLGLLLVFAGLGLGVWLTQQVVVERRGVARSLAALGQGAAVSRAPSLSLAQRVLLPALEQFADVGRALAPDSTILRLTRQLDLAGNPTPWTAERLLAVKAVSGLLAVPIGMIVLGGGGFLRAALFTAVLSVAIFFVPDLLVYNAGHKRQLRLQANLPDALDLLTICVEAGLGFDAGMAQVARNVEGPVAGEFNRVLQEMQIGKSRSSAFRALGERTTVRELVTFVSVLVQADKLGVPIAQILREQTKEMRVKRRQRAEEMAMKVPVKILLPMVVFILPVLFLVVIGPAGFQIAEAL